jgi:hypothetical protein
VSHYTHAQKENGSNSVARTKHALLHHASTKHIGEESVSIYWVRSYYGKPGKITEYLKWLNSDRAKLLASQIEKETGIKYLNTYIAIQSFGDYDAEDCGLHSTGPP